MAACGGGDGDTGATPDASGVGPDAGEQGADGGPTDAGADVEPPPLVEGLATLAGSATPGDEDGDRGQARFYNPVNMIVAPGGDLLVADFDNSLIRRVTPEGDVSTLSQEPASGIFYRPFGLALVGDWLFVQTDGNSLGQTQVAGGALWRVPVEGGAPELVRDSFGRARGLALLADGRIAATFYQEHVVRLYDPVSNTLTLLAGLAGTPGDVDDAGASARFNEPYDVLEVSTGQLLIADFGNHRLRQVGLDGHVTAFAGTGAPGALDGPIATATFHAPQGLARDQAGSIYVTDTGSYLVRRISSEGDVTTIAGDGSAGYRDSTDPLLGQLHGLEGIDVGGDGYLYIADGSRGVEMPYHRVRRLSLP